VAVDRQFHWRRPGRSVQSPPLLMSARTRTQLANAIGVDAHDQSDGSTEDHSADCGDGGLEADEPVSCACGRPLCSSEDEEWIDRRECQPEQDDAPGSKHWLTRQRNTDAVTATVVSVPRTGQMPIRWASAPSSVVTK
jgi:hypothetical protein